MLVNMIYRAAEKGTSSPRVRGKLVSQVPVAGLAKTQHRDLARVSWQFTLAIAAYDLIRLPKLLGPVVNVAGTGKGAS